MVHYECLKYFIDLVIRETFFCRNCIMFFHAFFNSLPSCVLFPGIWRASLINRVTEICTATVQLYTHSRSCLWQSPVVQSRTFKPFRQPPASRFSYMFSSWIAACLGLLRSKQNAVPDYLIFANLLSNRQAQPGTRISNHRLCFHDF